MEGSDVLQPAAASAELADTEADAWTHMSAYGGAEEMSQSGVKGPIAHMEPKASYEVGCSTLVPCTRAIDSPARRSCTMCAMLWRQSCFRA